MIHGILSNDRRDKDQRPKIALTKAGERAEKLRKLIDQYRWKAVVLVGGDFEKLINHKYLFFQNVAEAKDWLQQQAYHGAKLLVKGSRSMQMEKVLE